MNYVPALYDIYDNSVDLYLMNFSLKYISVDFLPVENTLKFKNQGRTLSETANNWLMTVGQET